MLTAFCVAWAIAVAAGCNAEALMVIAALALIVLFVHHELIAKERRRV